MLSEGLESVQNVLVHWCWIALAARLFTSLYNRNINRHFRVLACSSRGAVSVFLLRLHHPLSHRATGGEVASSALVKPPSLKWLNQACSTHCLSWLHRVRQFILLSRSVWWKSQAITQSTDLVYSVQLEQMINNSTSRDRLCVVSGVWLNCPSSGHNSATVRSHYLCVSEHVIWCSLKLTNIIFTFNKMPKKLKQK